MNYENYRLETKNRSFLVIRLFMVLVLVKLPKGEMFISTNELHLSLVIESLFDNTNKFTDSGSVTLKIKLDKAQSKLRIEVTDTGCGIPPEEREEYFCVCLYNLVCAFFNVTLSFQCFQEIIVCII